MYRSTHQDDVSFTEHFIPEIDFGEVVAYVADYLSPEEVFSDVDLETWAAKNGFVREDEDAA